MHKLKRVESYTYGVVMGSGTLPGPASSLKEEAARL